MRSRIWRNLRTREFFVGSRAIEGLSPLQTRILKCLLDNPNAYLTKTEIIEAAWPDKTVRDGVTDYALQQQISQLRKRLRQYSSEPYIITWRGIPEGGYRLVVNGRFDA